MVPFLKMRGKYALFQFLVLFLKPNFAHKNNTTFTRKLYNDIIKIGISSNHLYQNKQFSNILSHFALDLDHGLIATYDPSLVTKTTNSKFMFITFPPPSTSSVCFWIKFHKGEIIKTHPIQKVFVLIARDRHYRKIHIKIQTKQRRMLLLVVVVKEYLMKVVLLMFQFNMGWLISCFGLYFNHMIFCREMQYHFIIHSGTYKHNDIQ